MGLRSTIKGAVASAFNALGDIPEQATYRRTASAYNPATGTVVATNTDYTLLKAIFVGYDASAIDKVMILATDIKCLVQKAEFSVTPVISTDKIIRTSDGKVFNIIRFEPDPSGNLYVFQLRSPS